MAQPVRAAEARGRSCRPGPAGSGRMGWRRIHQHPGRRLGRPAGRRACPRHHGDRGSGTPVDRRPWLPRTAGTIARRANGHGVSATPQNVSRCRHDRFAHPGPLPVGEGDRERATRDFHRKDLR